MILLKYLAAVLLRPHAPEHKGVDHIVVITHSRAALYGPMRQALRSELGDALYTHFITSARRIETPDTIVLKNPNGSSPIWVSMYTIDAFLADVLDSSLPRDSTPKDLQKTRLMRRLNDLAPRPSLLVVDEAQHVFTHQANPQCFGQHELTQPGAVAAVMQRMMNPLSYVTNPSDKEEIKRLQKMGEGNYVILEDPSCIVTSAQTIIYPDNLHDIEDGSLDEIMRMPGTCKDACAPFCSALAEPAASGFLRFFPAHENMVAGPPCLYVEVEKTIALADHITREGVKTGPYLEACKRLGRADKLEVDDMIGHYAQGLVRALAFLQRMGLLQHPSRAAPSVAVVYPATVGEETAQRLLARTKEEAQSTPEWIDNRRKLLLALPDSVSTCKADVADFVTSSKTLWSSAENVAGLTFNVVIMVGFHFYDHLRHLNGQRRGALTRVDNRALIAASRCNHQLVVVECAAKSCFALHHRIAKAVMDGVDTVGTNVEKTTHSPAESDLVVVNNGTKLFLPITVDCRVLEGRPEEDLRLTLAHRSCVHILNFTAADVNRFLPLLDWSEMKITSLQCTFAPPCRSRENVIMLLDLLNRNIFPHVETLVLKGNSFPVPLSSFPFSRLRKLKHLDAGDMQLTGSIPEEIALLTRLQFLRLNNNSLSGSIPATIGALDELRHLHLEVNKISGPIPESISALSQLQRLFLHENLLSGRIPDSLFALTQLEFLALGNNQLCGALSPSIREVRVCLIAHHLSTYDARGIEGIT